MARFNGGANAGHTVVVPSTTGAPPKKFAFHQLPCGILHPRTVNLIGNGCVVHLGGLLEELKPLDAAGIDWKGALGRRPAEWRPRARALAHFLATPVSPRLRALSRPRPAAGRLKLSDRATLLFDFHKAVDGLSETRRVAAGGAGAAIGTTKQGIGPAYASKAARNAVRVGHLLHRSSLHERLRRLCADTSAQYGVDIDVAAELAKADAAAEAVAGWVVDGAALVHGALAGGQRVLAEGANAAMLDVDFGTFPFVTSSSTTAGGVCTGLGVPPSRVHAVVGVVKAYTTRVGGGPFPSELTDARGGGERPMHAEGTDIGLHLQTVGGEVGVTCVRRLRRRRRRRRARAAAGCAHRQPPFFLLRPPPPRRSTGRKRRCGWFDAVVVRYSHALNGFTALNLTKLDVLDELAEIKIAVGYKLRGAPLPPQAFPALLEDLSAVEVEYETMPGWQTSTRGVTTFAALPKRAQAYVRRLERLTGVPVAYIGTGPGRHEMITRGFSFD